MALARFRASVVPVGVQDVPDEGDQSATLDTGVEVPSVGAPLLAGLVVAMALARRRPPRGGRT